MDGRQVTLRLEAADGWDGAQVARPELLVDGSQEAGIQRKRVPPDAHHRIDGVGILARKSANPETSCCSRIVQVCALGLQRTAVAIACLASVMFSSIAHAFAPCRFASS